MLLLAHIRVRIRRCYFREQGREVDISTAAYSRIHRRRRNFETRAKYTRLVYNLCAADEVRKKNLRYFLAIWYLSTTR